VAAVGGVGQSLLKLPIPFRGEVPDFYMVIPNRDFVGSECKRRTESLMKIRSLTQIHHDHQSPTFGRQERWLDYAVIWAIINHHYFPGASCE
jgi:hypothetical protein